MQSTCWLLVLHMNIQDQGVFLFLRQILLSADYRNEHETRNMGKNHQRNLMDADEAMVEIVVGGLVP